jgi:hypothetical protein
MTRLKKHEIVLVPIAAIINEIDALFSSGPPGSISDIAAYLADMEIKYGREQVQASLVVAHLTAIKRLQFAL